ncbi:MAG: hypothetical protein IKK37_05340 [Clostridia bacterium]|nr:hypothetical protein [Clostridia bacterium]
MLCEKWIWLPEGKYPDRQCCCYSDLGDDNSGIFTVAEFKREYAYGKRIASAKLRFSADTAFQLYINGEFYATGPASVGGDFLGNEKPRNYYYAYETEINPDSDVLEFFARVRMKPDRGFEFSKGHGGFMLAAEIRFADGTKTVINTDNSWLVRFNGSYTQSRKFDSTVVPDEYVNAEEIFNLWHTETAPIPVCTESKMSTKITLAPGEKKTVTFELDKIYAGYVFAKADASVMAEIICRETTESGSSESVNFVGAGEYRSFYMHSAGEMIAEIECGDDSGCEFEFGFITSCYPVEKEAVIYTNDAALNQVLDTCRHTLKVCRQTLHLDSPKHCEPLACTGDYYIESLMTVFSFGDMRLAEFDLLRTAELIRNNGGRMFHTTYSLIWVRMLLDVYKLTGNKELLKKCEDALIMLLGLFETYIGDTQLIETSPDFMFVDWIYIDEISMHHPPKALGQTCLNLYYFAALGAAAEIYSILGESAMTEDCLKKRDTLRFAINSQLFDSEKGMYFEGLNTPSEGDFSDWKWMVANVEKRYYLKQSNILAAYVGICDRETARVIIHKIMSDEIPGDYQPYFAHYLLEAIYSNGLRDEYTLKVLERWKVPVAECPKGLVEGFIAPEPTYSFDHSHAWGGTPLWSLPKALTGFEMIKPAFEEVAFSPSLLGLEHAKVEMPTPYGDITVEMKQGSEPVITSPEEITIRRK